PGPTTRRDLAAALHAAGLLPEPAGGPTRSLLPESAPAPRPTWLAATAVELPAARQSGEEIDALLGRPTGWFAEHAGITSRCLWTEQDPLDAAARAARTCLERAG